MKRKKVLALAGAAVVVFLTGFSIFYVNQKEDEVIPDFVLTYAENQASDYPTTLGGAYFARLVKERTRGKVEIRIYDNSVLGDEVSVMKQIQYGGIDFARMSISTLADIVPSLYILEMPYLYRDSGHMWKVLDGEIGKQLMETMDNTDIVPLSWYDAGARSFYFREGPVETLEDLTGKKIRVPESALLIDLMTALGAVPVPLAFDKVYSALETGQIDGAENNWPSYDSMRHNEVAPYFVVDEHMRIPELQMMSRSTWDILPEEYQKVIVECARLSANYERSVWKERVDISRKRVIEEGCQEFLISDEEKQKFQAAVASVYEKYCGDQMDLLQKIQNVR